MSLPFLKASLIFPLKGERGKVIPENGCKVWMSALQTVAEKTAGRGLAVKHALIMTESFKED